MLLEYWILSNFLLAFNLSNFVQKNSTKVSYVDSCYDGLWVQRLLVGARFVNKGILCRFLL
jgi:hypothetical protein